MESILDKRVKEGMVYTGGSGGSAEYVVWKVREDVIVSKRINPKQETAGMSHASGYAWFAKGEFEFIRQMSQREFKELNQ